ncbi:MAG: hypothetical protein JWM16_3845 [Verrucomicrobiales bacterium]|nr:hypothetical protein [Verrucomicrobiales bacterium]
MRPSRLGRPAHDHFCKNQQSVLRHSTVPRFCVMRESQTNGRPDMVQKWCKNSATAHANFPPQFAAREFHAASKFRWHGCLYMEDMSCISTGGCSQKFWPPARREENASPQRALSSCWGAGERNALLCRPSGRALGAKRESIPDAATTQAGKRAVCTAVGIRIWLPNWREHFPDPLAHKQSYD